MVCSASGGISCTADIAEPEFLTPLFRRHYLAPFARIVLAIVYVREKDSASARQLLAQLHDDFPGNPLFTREMARLARAQQ